MHSSGKKVANLLKEIIHQNAVYSISPYKHQFTYSYCLHDPEHIWTWGYNPIFQ